MSAPLLTAAGLSRPAATFLARHGHAGARIEPLAGDASSRRYFRLPQAGLLLMEDRDDPTGFHAYLRLSQHLNEVGLSAPRIYGAAPTYGLALVEDFGDRTYAVCLADGEDESELYALAIDALLQLHQHPRATEVSQPHYAMSTLLDEIDIFSHWFAPTVAPTVDVSTFAAQFRALWHNALLPVADRHHTLVLRDFHVDNLMKLPERSSVRRCGLLDFQDAVIGPGEYDLVSLLQDARRDLAPGLEAAMLDHYVHNAPSALGTAEAIHLRYALLGAQRHARIAGVFLRLALRDGKPHYLQHLPRVLRQLEHALSLAGLTDIAHFLDRQLPDWQCQGATLASQAARSLTHTDSRYARRAP